MPSYEFFSDVDIKGNVLYNAVAHQAASDPAGKSNGFWYYNTVTHRFMFQQDGVFSDFGMSSLQDDTNPILAGALDTDGNQIRESLGTNVASQSSLPLPANGNYYRITGNSNVLGIDTIAVGVEVELEFVSVLDLIHHATSFILPTATDITTAAGDTARFREITAGNWKCTGYTRADGTPLVGGGSTDLVNDTTPQLGGVLDANGKQIREAKGADIASGTTLALGNDGNYFLITGNQPISGIAAKGVGTRVTLRFSGVPTLVHHATDFILPTADSFSAAEGDVAVFREYAEGDWVCESYQRATGNALKLGLLANSRIIARKTSGTGNGEQCTLSEVLDFIGTPTHGDILYRGSSSWTRLPKGTPGQVLVIGANDPAWATRPVVKMWAAESSTAFSTTGTIPFDNTIPQSSEGGEVITKTIVPTSTANHLRITVSFAYDTSAVKLGMFALFRDSVADAFGAFADLQVNPGNPLHKTLVFLTPVTTTSSQVWKFRAGCQSAGTLYINQLHTTGEILGATDKITMIIEEVTLS